MNGRKIVRGFLWMMIVPLAVGLGLWAGQAWSQQPTELDVRIGALSQSYKGQVAAAAEREATLTAELAATQMKLKAATDEVDRLKKLCAATCEPKKEGK